MTHGSARLIFIACRTFMFAIGCLLRIFNCSFCPCNALINPVVAELLQFIFKSNFFLLVHIKMDSTSYIKLPAWIPFKLLGRWHAQKSVHLIWYQPLQPSTCLLVLDSLYQRMYNFSNCHRCGSII